MDGGDYFWLGASADAETGSHPTGQAQGLGASRFDPARVRSVIEKHASDVRLGFLCDLVASLGLRMTVRPK